MRQASYNPVSNQHVANTGMVQALCKLYRQACDKFVYFFKRVVLLIVYSEIVRAFLVYSKQFNAQFYKCVANSLL